MAGKGMVLFSPALVIAASNVFPASLQAEKALLLPQMRRFAPPLRGRKSVIAS
jgi:hypothetical protein